MLKCLLAEFMTQFLIIVSKSIEENFVTFVGVPSLTIGTQSKVRRLSMQVEGEGNSIVPLSLTLYHVRSLNVFGVAVEIPSMMEFRHLRIMDFGGCHQLENHHLANVGRLFQLRYLNIRRTKVSELPEEIGCLRCLEMLDIRSTKVKDLPACIVNLQKLAHLLVNQGVRFPVGITKMQALETLKWCAWQSYIFWQELGQLKNLRKLDLNHDGAQEHKEVIASSLHNLCTQNLCSLTIWNDNDSILLNTLCTSPSLNIQKLSTRSCVLPKVPDWVGYLVNLQKLRLQVKRIRHEDLCILGALPSLLILCLENKENGENESLDRRLAVSREAGFRCLRVFTYFVEGDRMDLIFASRCMPKLEKLKTVFLGSFTDESHRSAGALYFGIENLPGLRTYKFAIRCFGTKRSNADAVKASVERLVSTHPNNRLNLIFEHGPVQS
ncbi:hypothetical protein VPH35_109237 [Triticum aestivum]|uniref:Disease resistance R13L4/SHOC-2-like LRR domain-containing protein n=2 Tax=Triticum TaxID=4564 RepID=A0A9R1B7S2_TRITD|nr:disease resistance protein RGA5-like isoform X2 [Triticum aestivum]VAI54590.1 unnamed protein product [Triticum turgidum subsp. durum]